MLSLTSPGGTLHLCGVSSKSTLGTERGGTCAVSRRPHPCLPRHTWWPNKPLRAGPSLFSGQNPSQALLVGLVLPQKSERL